MTEVLYHLHLQHNTGTGIMTYQVLLLKSSIDSSIFHSFLKKLGQNMVIFILIEVIQVLILGLVSDFN